VWAGIDVIMTVNSKMETIECTRCHIKFLRASYERHQACPNCAKPLKEILEELDKVSKKDKE
jgi:uncharacterized CHY-type Zn-finger protein